MLFRYNIEDCSWTHTDICPLVRLKAEDDSVAYWCLKVIYVLSSVLCKHHWHESWLCFAVLSVCTIMVQPHLGENTQYPLFFPTMVHPKCSSIFALIWHWSYISDGWIIWSILITLFYCFFHIALPPEGKFSFKTSMWSICTNVRFDHFAVSIDFHTEHTKVYKLIDFKHQGDTTRHWRVFSNDIA